MRVLNDDDYTGKGRKHDPTKHDCDEYNRPQRLIEMPSMKKIRTFSGPKELEPCGPSYKQKPHRLRLGERAVILAENKEVIVLRDYGKKQAAPFLVGCTCPSHEEDEICDMRRFRRNELLSLDYPLKDKDIKGELQLSLRHDDVLDRLVITPHEVFKVKDSKKFLTVCFNLKRSQPLDERGDPLDEELMCTDVSEDRKFPENLPLQAFNIMSDELVGETLFIEVWSKSKMSESLVGGVAIALDGLDGKPIERRTFLLMKDYRALESQLDEVIEDTQTGMQDIASQSTSSYGLSTHLPQEVTSFIDNHHMLKGSPSFGGEGMNFQEVVRNMQIRWQTVVNRSSSSKKEM